MMQKSVEIDVLELEDKENFSILEVLKRLFQHFSAVFFALKEHFKNISKKVAPTTHSNLL